MSPTRYFSDPSIATAALGLGPGDLMNDIRAYGWFFESMVVRNLRVYADALNGSVSHYLDRNGLECDAVVHLRNGTSGLVEVKLGGSALIEDGAKTLNALSGLIDTTRQKEVAFKMVVTATGDFAYQRPDGIIVCPLSSIRPLQSVRSNTRRTRRRFSISGPDICGVAVSFSGTMISASPVGTNALK